MQANVGMFLVQTIILKVEAKKFPRCLEFQPGMERGGLDVMLQIIGNQGIAVLGSFKTDEINNLLILIK